MRLKEDNSSWRASGIIKRDYQHGGLDLQPRIKSKKNTNKWCRGKVGVLHDYLLVEVRTSHIWGYSKWLNFKCANCGKKLTQWLDK